MNIVSVETKLVILKKFRLFTQLLGSVSDSKKQLKYAKKLIFVECKNINKGEYLLSEKDFTEIDVFMSELKEIAVRFTKVKNTDNYNRAKEKLSRFNENLTAAITKAEIAQAEEKGREIVGTVIEKAKTIGEFVNKGVNKIKETLSNVTQGDKE